MARLVPFCALAGCVAILAAPQADAALVISSAPTSNVSCSAGICTATAADAVLNAAELAAMLASADTRVSSGDQAQDLEVAVSLTWTQSTRLTLNALRNLPISAPVVAEGEGTVALNAGHGRNGGDYGFAGDGRVDFWSTGDKLTIRKKA